MVIARTNNVDAAKLLIDHGADVNLAEKWRGQTALMWASAEGQAPMVKELAAHRADLECPIERQQLGPAGYGRKSRQISSVGRMDRSVFCRARRPCRTAPEPWLRRGPIRTYRIPMGSALW